MLFILKHGLRKTHSILEIRFKIFHDNSLRFIRGLEKYRDQAEKRQRDQLEDQLSESIQELPLAQFQILKDAKLNIISYLTE